MKVCFPVAQDAGLESSIYGHLGTAPMFFVIDTETDETACMANLDPLAPETGCNVLKTLCSLNVDATIVEEIGDGFLRILNGLGIEVFQAQSLSVSENIALYKQKHLSVIEMLNSEKPEKCTSDIKGTHTCNHSHGKGQE
jgi:predicted Fe-Mo cluster-binding NifX family protein